MSLVDRGVEIFSIGVGSRTSANQMDQIASGKRYWFLSPSYDNLDDLSPKLTQSIQGGNLKFDLF